MKEQPEVTAGNLVSENELIREAKRIFPRLGLENSYLAALNYQCKKNKEWGLFVAENHFEKPVLKLDQRIMLAFRERDLIEQKNIGMLKLNDSGKAWYRRSMASSDPHAEQHQLLRNTVITTPEGKKQRTKMNDCESPLVWLRRRKSASGQPYISPQQYEAGERLRSDFTHAHLMASTTSSYMSPISGKKQRRAPGAGSMIELRDSVIEAKTRFFKALDAVGPELSGILERICCQLNGLEDAEKSFGWPKRSGKVVLRIALEILARHYGLTQKNRNNTQKPSRRHHWGADGYRPDIDGA